MLIHQPTIALGLLSLYRRLGAYTASYSKFKPNPYYTSQDRQDNTFLIRLKEEDEEKFMEHIFRSFYAPLCKTVYNITHDTEATEDIVQDVFMKVWRRKDQLDLSQSVKSYLFRSSVNTALNYLEKNRRNTSMGESDVNNLRYSNNNTEDELRYQEVSLHIDHAVQALPPRCRTVFALSRYEEMSYAEIADQLSISVKAVEKHMGKALKMMRMHLQNFINHST
ncbi:RNA polymerase sigma-70 factor (ECF subfamily) [Catalinimonas alkaloidigena]|uniref:RNA polymerase sigma factor n=1 Tax=Catalinimonas alkaloidigena TaxID=1075417 RepID=UPI0024069796|nr:RNA polymerase sigma-70 factor [Catalinimonas alkaloidigena]MDF9794810.1 RNA polymerase sigma-70 factor (ECF subfamily) [Catalinimonas alkaloidigena]